jgi:hypothetical protein
MKLYYSNNEKLEDFLEENNIIPIEYRGSTAIYRATPKFL